VPAQTLAHTTTTHKQHRRYERAHTKAYTALCSVCQRQANIRRNADILAGVRCTLCLWSHDCMRIPTETRTYTHTHAHTHSHTHTHIHTYTHTHIHTYTHTHIHTYTHTHIHAYTRKHIHTHIQSYTVSLSLSLSSALQACVRTNSRIHIQSRFGDTLFFSSVPTQYFDVLFNE